MTYDPFTDRLSDYIDGHASALEREQMESHLSECEDCTRLLADLRVLRREARALPPIEPPGRVWDSISSKLHAGDGGAATGSTLYNALAVAAAIVLGVSLWIAVSPSEPPAGDMNDPQALANMVTQELRAAESHYQNAIVGLEQIIEQNEGTLPQDLNQTIAENLDLIEQTIDESRNAIESNPGSTVAQESLLEAFRRKVSLLQSTILLINEVRKGEGENALDLIDEIRESGDPENPI